MALIWKTMKLAIILIVFCLFACKDIKDQADVVDSVQHVELINKQDVEKLKYVEFLPDAKVLKIIGNWDKYEELNLIVQDVKNANLSFFKANNEIVSTLTQELKTTVPERINSPQVMSRIIALETKIFKLESAVNLSKIDKDSTIESVKEFLVAFSNFNLQMNKKIEKESQNIQRPK